MSTNREGYTQAWRDDHRARGLCIDCNNPVVFGRVRCQDHLDKTRDAKLRYLDQKRKQRRQDFAITRLRLKGDSNA